MADKIKLVQRDNRPYITLTMTNASTGTPIDLTDAAVTVALRAVGTTTVLTIVSLVITNAAGGIGYFNFPGDTLDVPAGAYEGEVEVTFSNGDKQTVYDLLKFTIRSEVA